MNFQGTEDWPRAYVMDRHGMWWNMVITCAKRIKIAGELFLPSSWMLRHVIGGAVQPFSRSFLRASKSRIQEVLSSNIYNYIYIYIIFISADPGRRQGGARQGREVFWSQQQQQQQQQPPAASCEQRAASSELPALPFTAMLFQVASPVFSRLRNCKLKN